MACDHPFQGQRQTYVHIDGKEIPSSLEIQCLVCGYYTIQSPVESFYADTVRRSSRIIRDDRKAYAEFLKTQEGSAASS